MSFESDQKDSFFHALKILTPDEDYIASDKGTVFAFHVTLHLDDGKEIFANFWRTGGLQFRLECPNGKWVRSANFDLPITERLDIYRKQLTRWQAEASTPITFRDFNRLLAALSYQPESGTPRSD